MTAAGASADCAATLSMEGAVPHGISRQPSLVELFLALTAHLDRIGHGAVLQMFQEAEPVGGPKGVISVRHAGRVLRRLLSPSVSDAQLEFLLAVLDTDQDFMIDYNDVAAGIREWEAFAAAQQLGTSINDSLDLPDPIGALRDRLKEGGARGLERLQSEQVPPRQLVTLESLVAMLRRALPPVSDREHRRLMTSLSVLDAEGQGTTTMAAFMHAIGTAPDAALAEAETPRSLWSRCSRDAVFDSGAALHPDCAPRDLLSPESQELTASGASSSAFKTPPSGNGALSDHHTPLTHFTTNYTNLAYSDGSSRADSTSSPHRFALTPAIPFGPGVASLPPGDDATSGMATPFSAFVPPVSADSERAPAQREADQGSYGDLRNYARELYTRLLESEAELIAKTAVWEAKQERGTAEEESAENGAADLVYRTLQAQLHAAAEEKARLEEDLGIARSESCDLRSALEAVQRGSDNGVRAAAEATALREELEDLEQDAASWQLERTVMQEQAAQLEERCEELRLEARAAKDELCAAHEKAKELEAERKEAEEQLEAAAQREVQLQDALDESLAAVSAAEEQTARELGGMPTGPQADERAISPTADELSRLENEISRLEEDAAAWELDRMQMLEQLMAQQREKGEVEVELRAARAQVDQLMQALNEQQELHDQQLEAPGLGVDQPGWRAEQLRLAEKLEEAAARETEHLDAVAELANMAEEKAELIEQLHAAHMALQTREGQEGDKHPEATLCTSLSSESADVAGLRQQVQALTAEKEDAAKEVHGLLQQLTAMKAENADVLTECSSLQEQVDALAAAESGMRHQLDAMSSQRRDLKGELEGLQEQVSALTAEKGDLADENRSLQAQVDVLVAGPGVTAVTQAMSPRSPEGRAAELAVAEAAWEEDRAQMMTQLMAVGQEKSRLEAEHSNLKRHVEEMEAIMAEMQEAQESMGTDSGVDSSLGAAGSLLLEELHQERMQESAAWAEEKAALQAELAKAEKLAAQATVLAAVGPSCDDGPSGDSQQLQDALEELDGLEELRKRLQETEDECSALQEEVKRLKAATSPSPHKTISDANADMVSMAVLDDFREQHMEERAEWEAEKERLEGELNRLRSMGTGAKPVQPEASEVLATVPPPEDEGVVEALRRDLDKASGQRDALVAELRALRAADPPSSDLNKSLTAAVDVLVGDAMAGAREAALERQVDELRLDLEAALADAVELAKNPAWETDVPAEEWEAMLEEKEACLEGLLEERAAMEEHIAMFEGEKAALERKVQGLEGEKKALQGQMNMLMISSSDNESRLHELEADLSQIKREKKRLESQLADAGRSSILGEGRASDGMGDNNLLSADTEEILRLEDEVARLDAERQVLLQQMMAQTQEKGRLEAELKSLQGKCNELEILLQEMETECHAKDGVSQEDAKGSTPDLEPPFSDTGGNMVSMAVLEDFQEQQMEERNKWESERASMQKELHELKSRLGEASSLPGGKENAGDAEWQLVQ